MSAYVDANGRASGPPGLVLLAPPALEPVTLDEAKTYLRLDTADEDATVSRLIAAARQAAERATGRAFLSQGWRMTLDRWPELRTIELPFPPLQSVDAVALIDDAGAETPWPAENYLADPAAEPGRVVPREGVAPPLPGRDIAGLALDFTAGYGAQPTDVPGPLRQAMLLMVAYWFERRGDSGSGQGAGPRVVDALLAPYRVARL